MNDISNISGFPEYLPQQQQEFQKIIQKIRDFFEGMCALPVETPAVERLETLMLSAGSQKEIYTLGRLEEKQDTKRKLGLRFDLTTPLSRYILQHQHSLDFPLKCYQIQPVWRGERAQKGRYRQFYQCDLDIICKDKSYSAFYNIEILLSTNKILELLHLKNYKIRFSNKAVLLCLLDYFGVTEYNINNVLKILDKQNKISYSEFQKELEKYIPAEKIKDFFETVFNIDDSYIIEKFKLISKLKKYSSMQEEFISFITLYENLKNIIQNQDIVHLF